MFFVINNFHPPNKYLSENIDLSEKLYFSKKILKFHIIKIHIRFTIFLHFNYVIQYYSRVIYYWKLPFTAPNDTVLVTIH